MKKEKIKPLPVAKEFADYFVRRAKRVLGVKSAECRSISLDYYLRSEHVGVWFYAKQDEGILGRVEFNHDGRVTNKTDNRDEIRKLAAERGSQL